MDKYEFNIKAGQIRKMADKGDFQTAMQIADTIDWKRVKNANLLAYIADIYDLNKEYKEAGYIYRIALERTPQSKRFIYRLCEISIKSENINDAMDFYDTYCKLDPMDSSKFLLNYKILEKKGAGPDQLISVLENYTSMEIDEKWLYVLAVLYAKAGRDKDAVKICDKISLLFGFGKYVDKALELKMNFAPLSGQQIDLINNKEKYEKKLEMVSETYRKKNKASDVVEKEKLEDSPYNESDSYVSNYDEDDNLEDEDLDIKETPSSEEIEDSEIIEKTEEILEDEYLDDELETESELDYKIENEAEDESEDEIEDEVENDAEISNDQENEIDLIDMSSEDDESANNYNMIIESDTDEKAFETAIEEIRYYHSKYNLNFKVAKTSSDRVNKSGFNVFIPKISDKDFIIENAGELSDIEIENISKYIKNQKGQQSLILIDSVDKFDNMAKHHPEFMKLFDVVSDITEDDDTEETFENLDESSNELDIAKEDKADIKVKKENVRNVTSKEDNKEVDEEEFRENLSLDEFVKKAMEYSESIDCTIPGKTVLAIYERAEYMKDNGEILDKISAENLVEEAADKAENPGIGKKLSSMFSSKYDKDDKLILRKEDFLI